MAEDNAADLEKAFVDARQHHAAGRLSESERRYRDILALQPESVLAHYELANVLRDRGQADAAITNFRQAIALKPDFADAHRNLGNVFKSQRQLTRAIACLCAAIALERSFSNVYSLAAAFLEQGMMGDALTLCEEAVRLDPDSDAAHTTIGDILYNLGRWDEAVKAYERAVALKPHSARAHSNLLFVVSRTQAVLPEQALALARRFEAQVCTTPAKPFVPRPIDLNSKLRIGILSAEVGQHPVAYFLESFLRHYDRTRFEVTLYSTVTWHDAKRGELLALADRAKDLNGVPDDDARDQIMTDAIDILIETTGHTSNGKLRMLSQRCAPVQCHYIGYFGTSGVAAIDYFICDDELTPAQFGSHFSEKLVRLPRLWMAYAPPADCPAPQQDSADDEIVLGSFNSLAKVGDEMLGLWSRLLRVFPPARLVLKDRLCADDMSCRRITAYFESRGIEQSRIVFLRSTATWSEHMSLYNRIDIALDAFPFNSVTTAFDALFMGTPLVAMRRNCLGGRQSSSILKALGHADWVAENEDDYVAIVRTLLSADKRALKEHKRSLRGEVLRSPLCDGVALARALEQEFVTMAADYNARQKV